MCLHEFLCHVFVRHQPLFITCCSENTQPAYYLYFCKFLSSQDGVDSKGKITASFLRCLPQKHFFPPSSNYLILFHFSITHISMLESSNVAGQGTIMQFFCILSHLLLEYLPWKLKILLGTTRGRGKKWTK